MRDGLADALRQASAPAMRAAARAAARALGQHIGEEDGVRTAVDQLEAWGLLNAAMPMTPVARSERAVA
ncbi:hypothetical protein ACCQ05_02120 [Xanthomonas sp. NCPPB 3582]|uniref:hypothetical protein n=1 Tax=Xanthomonas sp. NCPPB 3582 TaxID=487557 RepID=UPI0035588C0D